MLGIGPGIAIIPPTSRAKADQEAHKAAKEQARAEGKIPLTAEDAAKVERMAERLSEHRLAMQLLGAGEPEVSAYAVDEATGVTRRGRFDWLGPAVLTDYKTTSSADPRDLSGRYGAIKKWGYDKQAAWYTDLARDLGHPASAFAFIFQMKEPPYLVTVAYVDDNDSTKLAPRTSTPSKSSATAPRAASGPASSPTTQQQSSPSTSRPTPRSVSHDRARTAQPTNSLSEQMTYARAVLHGRAAPAGLPRQARRHHARRRPRAVDGLSPAESLYRIDVIQGKPTASAELIAANVRKAGHKLRLRVDEQAVSATCTIIRADDPDYEHTVTRDQAWLKRWACRRRTTTRSSPRPCSAGAPSPPPPAWPAPRRSTASPTAATRCSTAPRAPSRRPPAA